MKRKIGRPAGLSHARPEIVCFAACRTFAVARGTKDLEDICEIARCGRLGA